MSNADKQGDILRAMRQCLEPIAEILLRSGVSYEQFSDACKLAFVQTASRRFGVRGRETNISRVAVMTGLSRKEVTRLKTRLLEDQDVASQHAATPAAMVLAGWHTDADFVDDTGRPLVLPFDAEFPSLAALVTRYAGDVPPGAVRAELKRAQAVEEQADGRLKVLKRYFVPPLIDEKLVNSIELMLAGLAATIARSADPDRAQPGHIHRFVFSDTLSASAVRLFRNVARQRSQELLESLDDWLGSNQVQSEFADEPVAEQRVGVGVFYYEGPKPAGGKTAQERPLSDLK